MSTVTIEVPDERLRELEARAAALGVSLEALIQASIADLLTRPSEAVESAAEYVLAKNAELYRRLA
jgi:antitoxin FitA